MLSYGMILLFSMRESLHVVVNVRVVYKLHFLIFMLFVREMFLHRKLKNKIARSESKLSLHLHV